MAGELGAVVEGDGLAPGRGQGAQQPGEGGGNRGGRFAGGRTASSRREWRSCTVSTLGHKCGRASDQPPNGPGSGGRCAGGPFGQRPAAGDVGGGATAPAAPPATTPLGAGEIVSPGPIWLGASSLGIDEAIDVSWAMTVWPASRRSRPAICSGDQPCLRRAEHLRPERGIAVQAGATPAPSAGLLLGIPRPVALLAGAIAFQLASNGRWRAIQSCSDLPERAPLGV